MHRMIFSDIPGNFTTLVGQYLNVFLLYKLKDLFGNKNPMLKFIAVVGIPAVLFISLISNAFVFIINSFVTEDKKGSFAIYNLGIARKV